MYYIETKRKRPLIISVTWKGREAILPLLIFFIQWKLECFQLSER